MTGVVFVVSVWGAYEGTAQEGSRYEYKKFAVSLKVPL